MADTLKRRFWSRISEDDELRAISWACGILGRGVIDGGPADTWRQARERIAVHRREYFVQCEREKEKP